jgi:hypothetical protein
MKKLIAILAIVIASVTNTQAKAQKVAKTEISQNDQIKIRIQQGITSQIQSHGVYDPRLESILLAESQSQLLRDDNPDFSAYTRVLKGKYDLSESGNIDSLVAGVVENTFKKQSSLFPGAVNADPRHENSPENKNGYRYAVVVEYLGNNSYKINTVICSDRTTTERGY